MLATPVSVVESGEKGLKCAVPNSAVSCFLFLFHTITDNECTDWLALSAVILNLLWGPHAF